MPHILFRVSFDSEVTVAEPAPADADGSGSSALKSKTATTDASVVSGEIIDAP